MPPYRAAEEETKEREAEEEMIIICREVDRNTGKIAVYPLDAEVTDRLLFVLGLRARLNPELTYYATTKARYADFAGIITGTLKRRNVTPAAVARIGGVVPI